jgi:hypothetical protein
VCVTDDQGRKHVLRRLRLTLHAATRDGATLLHLLTNLPRQVLAQRVADLYRTRWTRETACQH